MSDPKKALNRPEDRVNDKHAMNRRIAHVLTDMVTPRLDESELETAAEALTEQDRQALKRLGAPEEVIAGRGGDPTPPDPDLDPAPRQCVAGLEFEPDRFADFEDSDYAGALAAYEAEPRVRVLFENGGHRGVGGAGYSGCQPLFCSRLHTHRG